MKSAETSSSRRCSQPIFQIGSHDSPAAALGDRLAVELAEEFALSGKQRQRVTEFFESHGQGYVRSKAERTIRATKERGGRSAGCIA